MDAAHRPSFGEEHFGACDLGDRRLTRRAVVTADALMRHPGGTLPAKLPRAELRGFYGLANNPRVAHATLLAAHCARTRDAMAACPGVVLVIHDTTEADFGGLDVPDLGPIGNGGRRGLLLHNVLAVDYANREAIGLAGQFVHRRRTVRKGEGQAAKRRHPQRESRLWVRGAEAVGRPPAGATWVNLMDRGGDTFEGLARQVELGQHFVVRSRSNRNVEVRDARGHRRRSKLHRYARRLPTLGTRTVAVAAGNDGRAAREATVRVAGGPVRVPPPAGRRGEHADAPLDLSVVHVLELGPPPGEPPLEWVVLCDLPAAAFADACRRVDWYACRPTVEEYHKAMKTGCGVELPQFTTRRALEATVAMLSVVAVQLLRLRDLARRPDAPARRADEVVDGIYVEVLGLWRFGGPRPAMSVKDFLYALARLGGHQGRAGDRPPGWLVLWRGWQDLQRLVDGARLVRLKRSG
jgi:hypothetical protein